MADMSEEQAPDQGQSDQQESASGELPTGGNEAQAAAVFGEHVEAPAEMDSGGAG